MTEDRIRRSRGKDLFGNAAAGAAGHSWLWSRRHVWNKKSRDRQDEASRLRPGADKDRKECIKTVRAHLLYGRVLPGGIDPARPSAHTPDPF